MKSILVDGKQYECKRYTLEELEKLFDGKVVVLDEALMKDLNLVSGILVEICDTETKDIVMEKNIQDGKNYMYWDLSPEPVLTGYKELRFNAV